MTLKLREMTYTQLMKAHTEGGDDNQLLLQVERGYIFFRLAKGKGVVHIEVAAGRALQKPLSSENAQMLYDQGFRRKTAADNYTLSLPCESEEAWKSLAQRSTHILSEIYQHQSSEKSNLRLTLGSIEELKNERLISAMTHMSKERSSRARQKLYWAFVRAELLFAIERKSSEDKQPTPFSFSELTGYKSAAVFTDIESMRLYDPRGLKYIKMNGREIARLLVERRQDSLLINPRGRCGGEFYRPELESIDEAMKRYDPPS